jgi:hypothetical protein
MSNTTQTLCSYCGVPAPTAKSAGTLANKGWRIEQFRDERGEPSARWICAACYERKTGSAPLQKREPS